MIAKNNFSKIIENKVMADTLEDYESVLIRK